MPERHGGRVTHKDVALARALRIQYPGAWFHLLSRGNARQQVFLAPRDYARFLDLLGETCTRFEWLCPAHCLMPNHYHLLVRVEHANLSLGMRHLNGVFTQRYNQEHGRVGHLFQGRFKALLVQDESYLCGLVRYILRNPVRAGLASDASDWRWSAHRWLAGRETAPPWAAPREIWQRLGASAKSAETILAALLGRDDDDGATRWSRDGVIGGPAPRRRLAPLVVARRREREHPRAERFADRPALQELLRDEGGALRALTEWGYTQRDLARASGLSEATISRQFGAACRARRARRERKKT